MIEHRHHVGDVAPNGVDGPVALKAKVPIEGVERGGELLREARVDGAQVDALIAGTAPLPR